MAGDEGCKLKLPAAASTNIVSAPIIAVMRFMTHAYSFVLTDFEWTFTPKAGSIQPETLPSWVRYRPYGFRHLSSNIERKKKTNNKKKMKKTKKKRKQSWRRRSLQKAGKVRTRAVGSSFL